MKELVFAAIAPAAASFCTLGSRLLLSRSMFNLNGRRKGYIEVMKELWELRSMMEVRTSYIVGKRVIGL